MSSASWIGRCGTTSERCEEDEEVEEVDVEDESEQGEVVGVACRGESLPSLVCCLPYIARAISPVSSAIE